MDNLLQIISKKIIKNLMKKKIKSIDYKILRKKSFEKNLRSKS